MSEKKNAHVRVPLRTPCAQTLNYLANAFILVILIACVASVAEGALGKTVREFIASGKDLIPWMLGILGCYVVKGFAVIVEWFGLCVHANQNK